MQILTAKVLTKTDIELYNMIENRRTIKKKENKERRGSYESN